MKFLGLICCLCLAVAGMPPPPPGSLNGKGVHPKAETTAKPKAPVAAAPVAPVPVPAPAAPASPAAPVAASPASPAEPVASKASQTKAPLVGSAADMLTPLMGVLDKVLAAVAASESVPRVLDMVMGNPTLVDLAADGVIFALRNDMVNLVDMLIGLHKSGLIIQTLHLSVEDPNVVPGMLAIGGEIARLRVQTLERRSVETLFERESVLLNDVMTSLANSGLARQTVQHLMTAPHLTEPAARFVDRVIEARVLTVRELISAVVESGIAPQLMRDVITDRVLLAQFGQYIRNFLMGGIFSFFGGA
ncbi:hypothetical protein DICA1_B03334 [Diutina catenulata]